MNIEIYTDGGARGNPGPAASAAVLWKEGEKVAELSVFLGNNTNNYAEYSGVLLALEWTEKNVTKPSEVTLNFFLDSLLVVSQLKGVYKIKNEILLQLVTSINQKINNYKGVTYTHIPRAKNADADKLVNSCLDNI